MAGGGYRRLTNVGRQELHRLLRRGSGTPEDGTARAQAVKEEVNPRYYALLKEIETLTGNGVVLNTSLNRRGEPVVCTPEDAIKCFLGTRMDVLVLNNFLVKKGRELQE